jgi:hypothetical protein
VKLLPLALAAIVMAGCASLSSASDDEDDFHVPFVCSPTATRVPCTSAAAPGVSYRFNLLTHCGIEWAYFDGRYWVPRAQVDPPSHWANIEAGTMVRERNDVAVFEADKGGGASFAPAPKAFRPENCE